MSTIGTKVSALILENTFTSILDMAGVLLPFLKWFIGGSSSKGPKILSCLVRSPWSTIDVIGQIEQPISFLSGLQDEMVPPPHMWMLYNKAIERNSECLFVDFPNGMHMDTWLSYGDIGELFSYFWINMFLRHGEALEVALMMTRTVAMMDNVQNQLIQFELLLTPETFIVAIFGVVPGIFGMDFDVPLFKKPTAFLWVLIIIGICSVIIFCSFVWFFRYKRLMPL